MTAYMSPKASGGVSDCERPALRQSRGVQAECPVRSIRREKVARIPARLGDGPRGRRGRHVARSSPTQCAVPAFDVLTGVGRPSAPLRWILSQRVDAACRFSRLRPSLHRSRAEWMPAAYGSDSEGSFPRSRSAAPSRGWCRRSRNQRWPHFRQQKKAPEGMGRFSLTSPD